MKPELCNREVTSVDLSGQSSAEMIPLALAPPLPGSALALALAAELAPYLMAE